MWEMVKWMQKNALKQYSLTIVTNELLSIEFLKRNNWFSVQNNWKPIYDKIGTTYLSVFFLFFSRIPEMKPWKQWVFGSWYAKFIYHLISCLTNNKTIWFQCAITINSNIKNNTNIKYSSVFVYDTAKFTIFLWFGKKSVYHYSIFKLVSWNLSYFRNGLMTC